MKAEGAIIDKHKKGSGRTERTVQENDGQRYHGKNPCEEARSIAALEEALVRGALDWQSG
jgi:hypothetical protein